MTVTKDIAAPAINGGKFARQPQITLKDQYGNICFNNSVTQVTAAKNDSGSWTLTGTVKLTADKGIVSYSNLGASNTSAVKDAQLKFSAAGLADVIGTKVTLPESAANAYNPQSSSPPSDEGSNNTDFNPYVKEVHIVGRKNKVDIDLNQGSTLLSVSQLSSLAAQNKKKPIILAGNGYTLIFPKGTIKKTNTNRDCDMRVVFDTGAHASAIRSLTGTGFIKMLDFSQHGKLPGAVQIRFYAGKQYAGKTLFYYRYNPANSGFILTHAVRADKKGYITVIQSYGAEYVLSNTVIGKGKVS